MMMFNIGGLCVLLPRAKNELVQFKYELSALKPAQWALNKKFKKRFCGGLNWQRKV